MTIISNNLSPDEITWGKTITDADVPKLQTELNIQMDNTRARLLEVANQKNVGETKNIVTNMIKLRARQYILDIKKYDSKLIGLTPDVLEKITAAYYKDCFDLAKAVDELLEPITP